MRRTKASKNAREKVKFKKKKQKKARQHIKKQYRRQKITMNKTLQTQIAKYKKKTKKFKTRDTSSSCDGIDEH